ncbi:UDP-N-acetylenolpyruvoylglucosamine reductase [bacterium]|nr:MAG: UDP-N-acetylenolpyruvoylglucosamine reductase [bacterium]
MSVSERVIKALRKADIGFKQDVLLSELTSFHIGGPADILVLPETAEQIRVALSVLSEENIPVFPFGRGTNILAADSGFRGALLRPTSTACDIYVNRKISAGAALPLNELVESAIENGFAGCENLAGIPGSVGGAIAMNAGAWEVSVGDFVDELVAFDLVGNEAFFDIGGAFDYRSFEKRGQVVIAEAILNFDSEDDPEVLAARAEKFKTRRAENQPIRERSAGCIFKNPPGEHAGWLIEQTGLKGISIGGAQVSEVHANFILNRDNASSRDVIRLIKKIREQVRVGFEIELELEVITLGFEL